MSNLHQEAAQAAARVSEHFIRKSEDRDAIRAYVAIGAITGTLEPLAFLVAKNHQIDNDVVLFAALLAARAIRIDGVINNDKFCAVDQHSEFGAVPVYDALLSFEKLTGRNIDHKLNVGMVAAARDPECRAAMERQRAKVIAQEERQGAMVH